jgi:hypothetical protein
MAIIDAPKCQHQQEDGTGCQRPARRRLRLCDFHHREHKRNAKRIAERARQRWFERVALGDPRSIQKALAQVMQRLLNGEIDPDRAGQLLRKLHLATLDCQEGKSGRLVGLPRTQFTVTGVKVTGAAFCTPVAVPVTTTV